MALSLKAGEYGHSIFRETHILVSHTLYLTTQVSFILGHTGFRSILQIMDKVEKQAYLTACFIIDNFFLEGI